MPLMPTTKVWTSPEGVQIEFITYRTILVDRIRKAIAGNGVDTDEDLVYILCASTTLGVTLPENPPLWAEALHSLVKSPDWLKDPRADYDSLRYAPSDLLLKWWIGYSETRDKSHAAPADLQKPAPLRPDIEVNEETGEVLPRDNAHPTGAGKPSLKRKSSAKFARSSIDPVATPT